MGLKVNQINDGGVAAISGLTVYMTVTINSQEFLIPIVAEEV